MAGFIATSVREADRVQYLTKLYFGVEIYVPVREVIAPSATPGASSKTIPTSAYGQTIPVIYGKARVPSAYIWAAPLDVKIDGDAVTVNLTARLRFARPLVANSNWRVRRMWANGNLIWDKSAGIRSPTISYFAEYDGQSTQGRDPVMVAEEGDDEVSAHRGYLDVVITMDLGSQASQPPAFDAEWIQDPESSVEVEEFAAFIADAIDTVAAVNFASNTFYGISIVAGRVRRFSISTLQEVYSVAINGLGRAYTGYAENSLRYISSLQRLLVLANVPGIFGGMYPILINPANGSSVAEGDEIISGVAGQGVNTDVLVMFGAQGIYICASSNLGYLSTYRINALVVERTFLSGIAWDGRGVVECFAIGETRASNADIWVCAGTTLYKFIATSTGAINTITTHATFADDLVHAVYYDGDVIVWTDNAQAIRVDGVTGSTVWTVSVPYQIPSAATDRSLTPPDMNRYVDEFYFQESTVYNFTSLENGESRTISGAPTFTFRHVYDGANEVLVTTDNTSEPLRTTFDNVGDGTIRDLEDFLAALTEVDESFTSAQHLEINITDQIQGAVIDVTSGIRDVAKSVAGPYSIAIFERAGQIIYKRALTDGSFAVDATLVASDFADRGGQAIRAKRLNAEEFIARYGINYRDPDEIYQSRTQFGEIQFTPFPLSPTDLSIKVDIPIIMDGTTIKTLATKHVNRLAEEKHEFTMLLRATHADKEPEDVLRFDYAGRTVTVRVIETTTNPDFTIEVRATEFLSAVAATVAGAVGRPFTPTPVGDVASVYYHLDIPLQEDTDDLGGAGLVQYHVLTSEGQDNWDGATLYRLDSTYTAVKSQTEDGLVGVALTAMPDTDNPYVTEFTRTLNVAFLTGDTSLLTTKTYLEVMNGANKFAIGAPGRWEICQVITITDNGNGSFAFTGWVRGRGVSEEHTGTHAVGDFVVWLSEENVQHLDYTIAQLDDTFNYKAVGFGGSVTGTTATSEQVTGEAEKIPKPCQLDASIDSPSDVRLSWVRRGRIGVIWDDDGDFTTPLGETLEQYVIRIKDGPGGTVLRTVTVNDATLYDYSGALQISDFGGALSTGDDLTYDIRQVSGTGVICPTREATITL